MTIFQSGRLINSCYVWHGMVSSLRQNPIWWRYSYRADGPPARVHYRTPANDILSQKTNTHPVLYTGVGSYSNSPEKFTPRLETKTGKLLILTRGELVAKIRHNIWNRTVVWCMWELWCWAFHLFLNELHLGNYTVTVRCTSTFTNSYPRYFLISKV